MKTRKEPKTPKVKDLSTKQPKSVKGGYINFSKIAF